MSREVEEDDEYRSSDDEDYVPEDAEDVDEPSGDECAEVQPGDDQEKGNQGRGKKRHLAAQQEPSNTKVPSSSTNELGVSAEEFFAQMKEESCADLGIAQNSSKSELDNKAQPSSSNQTSKIVEVFDFAGEEIRVEKSVSAEEAKLHQEKEQKKTEVPKAPSRKRGGFGEALTLLTKKKKISVLDKSQLDWKSFKAEEKIDEELSTFNKGKGGFLQQQDFLAKADQASFNREKGFRDAIRKNK